MHRLVHRERSQPEIAAVPRTVQRILAEDVQREQCNHDRLNQALANPHEKVSVVEDAVLLSDEVYIGKQLVQILVHLVLRRDEFGLLTHHFVRPQQGLGRLLGISGLDDAAGLAGSDIVDILFEDGPDHKRERGEEKVVHRNVDIIEYGLAGITRVEREDELRDGEKHVFVEEVEDHLGNPDVVPPPVHQYQPPQHAELG